jgi:hypothetical protein
MKDVKPGATVDGPILFDADLRFEDLAHQSPAGQTVLTMISDDNFSAL